MEYKNTEIYRGFPFLFLLGVRHLFVIENASITVFHYDKKCLQVYDYKDSFHSLIFYDKQSHKIQSSTPLEIGHPQDLRISSFHEILWNSSLLCSKLWSPWTLYSSETTPKPFGGEKCLLFFKSLIHHQDPWEKQILQVLYHPNNLDLYKDLKKSV